MDLSNLVGSAGKKIFGALQIRNLIVSVLVGLALTAAGFFLGKAAISTKVAETYAVVDSVEASDEDFNLVTASYTVDGITYSSSYYVSSSSTIAKGDKVAIFYHVNDPSVVSESDNTVLSILGPVLCLVGILVIAAGIYEAKVFFTKMKLEEKARSLEGVTEDMVYAVENDASPVGTYEFRAVYAEKMNELMASKKCGVVSEGFGDHLTMKDAEGHLIYEIDSRVKMSSFGTNYTFTNNKSMQSFTKNIKMSFFGRTSVPAGRGSIVSGADKNFVVDGKLFWEMLFKEGYYFNRSLDGLCMHFSLMRYGIEIATIDTMSAGETINMTSKLLKNIPSVGQFKVVCHDSDLDTVAMICLFLFQCSTAE